MFPNHFFNFTRCVLMKKSYEICSKSLKFYRLTSKLKILIRVQIFYVKNININIII